MPCAAPTSMTLCLYPASTQAVVTLGCWAATRSTTVRPPVVSCTLAAVTNTTSSRPSTSVATCRLRPLIFLPASIPCECSGTLPDVLTVCASRIAAVGSAARPAARRTLPRNTSWIASVMPSFSHKAK